MAKRRKPTSHIRRRALIEAKLNRSKGDEEDVYLKMAQELTDGLTDVQRDFVLDTDTQKAALCSRRSGKTWAAKMELLISALTNPHSNNVYINSSRRECRQIIWLGKDGIKAICKRYGLIKKEKKDSLVQTNETYLELAFSNGSFIRLVGVDDASEMEKLRGDSYDKVVIDECATVDSLGYFVDDVITPALGDRMGTISLIGTPSLACTGLFYDITRENSSVDGWSVHKWTHKDNTAKPLLVDYFQKIKDKKGWEDDNPTWLRENCAVWIKSSELFVYAFNKIPEEERYCDELPDVTDSDGNILNSDWEYICGVDLGYNDAFAYSIWAYNDHHPVAYEVRSFKESKLHSGQQADLIVDLCKEFDFSKIVIDGDPAVIQGWRERRGIMGERAEKPHKHAYISQLNAAMVEGKVRFRRGSQLAKEMASLQWKESTINSPKPKENKSKETPNDIADAALYAWKELFNFAWAQVTAKPLDGTVEYYKQLEEQLEEQFFQNASGKEPNNFYDMYGD